MQPKELNPQEYQTHIEPGMQLLIEVERNKGEASVTVWITASGKFVPAGGYPKRIASGGPTLLYTAPAGYAGACVVSSDSAALVVQSKRIPN